MKSGQRLHNIQWHSPTEGLIFLARDWPHPKKLPPLELLPGDHPCEKIRPLPSLAFGALAGYYRHGDQLNFYLEPELFPKIPLAAEGCWVAGEFNDWKVDFKSDKWRLKPLKEKDDGTTPLGLSVRLLDLIRNKPWQFKFICGDGSWVPVPEGAPNKTAAALGPINHELRFDRTGRHVFLFSLPKDFLPSGHETVGWRENGEIIDEIELPPTELFLNVDCPERLGAHIEGLHTRFRVFAPRATAVWIDWSRDPAGKNFQTLTLDRSDAVCWTGEVFEDLDGAYYWIRVDGNNYDGSSHFDGTFRLLDPWARAAVSPTGPGIILADDHFPPAFKPFQPPRFEDLIVLESHVRDLVALSPHAASDGPNGFRELAAFVRDQHSYLRTLGVNALELQPVQEFDAAKPTDYHWGYMPVNYFAPASSFASDPLRATQVAEFRDLVHACHDAGMAVILDVVYNHVGEPNNLLFLDKYYFFEEDGHHNLMNWSGCGNDLRTKAPVVRRLIVDSLVHLVRTYDIDGFRFDLADLVGTEALMEVEVALRTVKPGIILIAEPWSFRGNIRHELIDSTYASWNDEFRNFLVDYVQANGHQEAIDHFLKGSPGFGHAPWQTVNYTQSHDDYAWIDRITVNPDNNGFHATQIDRRRTHLMLAAVLLAPGLPMLAQGQDFLHSKHGVHNTYLRGDLNALDYQRQIYYSNSHRFTACLIRFRLSDLGRSLRLGDHPGEGYFQTFFADGFSAIGICYNADGSGAGKALFLALNPHLESVTLPLGEFDLTGWIQIGDHERLRPEGLNSALLPVAADSLTLPALTLGLWMKE
jgi:pullulanase